MDQAFAEGELSYSKVRAITRVATPDNEGFMVCMAEPDACAAAPEVEEEARREQARELYWFQDEDGMWIIHAKLPPEQGQLVMKALQAVARPLEEERQEEWKARMQAVARNILRRST